MKIIIFGGTGNVGSRTVTEALSRNHQVSVVVRNTDRLQQLPTAVTGHVANLESAQEVSNAMHGHDLIITAVRPATGHEALLTPITETIMNAAAKLNIRVLVVGGAASLKIPNQNDTVLSAANFLPDAVRPIAQACYAQHQMVEQSDNKNWAYVSPAAMLVPGERSGVYRLGKDELVCNAQGESKISMEDFAMALIDEAEQPKHHQTRFTAAY